jgi:hypothetical protein
MQASFLLRAIPVRYGVFIYDRCIQIVIETSDYSGGWDGKESPTGVYSWVISYSDMDGKVAKLRGSVMLVR